MGACPLLCRRDDFDLDILFHLTYRFLNPDYCVLDCCGMALREANLKPLVAYGPARVPLRDLEAARSLWVAHPCKFARVGLVFR